MTTHIETKIIYETQKLVSELHSPITRKLKRSKLYSPYQVNILSEQFANMQLPSKHS